MKSKSTGSNKKGFYGALAAGAGALLVLTLVLSFSNLTLFDLDPQQQSSQAELAEPLTGDTVMAGYDHTVPYAAQAESDQALFRPRQQSEPQPSPSPSNEPETPVSTPVVDPTNKPSETEQPEKTEQTEAATEPKPEEPEPETPPQNDQTPGPTAQEQATFEPFTEASQLVWPVQGDIAMSFSQDSLVYNPTLDQWRTNDDLRISAQEGTPVRAAASGQVTEVGNDRVYGNFVRIDNGNGWETIYGQLMDGVLVVEGDIVQTGQVVGGVGRPSVFSVMNGHHVSLRVLHEDNLMDPKLLLADVTE